MVDRTTAWLEEGHLTVSNISWDKVRTSFLRQKVFKSNNDKIGTLISADPRESEVFSDSLLQFEYEDEE